MLSTGDNPLFSTSSIADALWHTLATSPCSQVLIQNDPGSAGNMQVSGTGGSTNFLVLQPGQGITIVCSNPNQVAIKFPGATGTVNYVWVN
jgi:hypothetical protein